MKGFCIRRKAARQDIRDSSESEVAYVGKNYYFNYFNISVDTYSKALLGENQPQIAIWSLDFGGS